MLQFNVIWQRSVKIPNQIDQIELETIDVGIHIRKWGGKDMAPRK